MTNAQREELFLEHQNLIHYTVRRNASLVRRLRMDADDMFQELAIVLLQAIESYDAARGMKPANYYLKMLQYGVLKINREQSRLCRLANLTARPLVFVNDDGEEIEMDLPYNVDYTADLSVGMFLEALSEREREVLLARQNGTAITDKRQKNYLNLIKKKAARYCALGGL